MKEVRVLIAVVLCTTILSCTTDAYDKGEGTYSQMRADLAEAYTTADKSVTSVVTDDGEQMDFEAPYTAKWLTTADSVYRVLLYYNKVKNANGRNVAQVVSMSQVPSAHAHPQSYFNKGVKTDPVKFESVWIGKSQRYMNIGLIVMTGDTGDNKKTHHLGMVNDTTIVNADGTRTCYLTLYHDQDGVPEYYSQHLYLCVPVYDVHADSICLNVNTYNGSINRTLILRH